MTAIELTNEVKRIILSQYSTQYKAAKAIGKPQSHLFNLLNRPSYNAALQLATEFNIPFSITIGE